MDHLQKLKNGFSSELDIKKLEGKSNYYRLRVGNYRVLFTIRPPNIIIIFVIRPRKSAYKR
ncbi:MAG: type II toxin-antitoxin system RelE/ParE family toxin [Candidatus Lokiarchaeota archaeon]|nr:type II toxin-antitoxin system RelE/ParE family toxin [Candidatus Lokiarchaeota archaeon]